VFTYITFICPKKVQKEIEWSKDMVLVKKKMCALLKSDKIGFWWSNNKWSKIGK
jgi:hypothetical protein